MTKERKLIFQGIAYKLAIVSFVFLFSFNLYNHLTYVKYIDFVDLRNRVVGARLMNENISPYYFKWHPSDPLTLFDPADFCNINNNMITAPPSFLLLIQPLAKLDYGTICYIWLITEYLFFLLIFFPVYFLFKDRTSRILIALAGIFLLFTDNWNDFIVRGQSHFIFPALIANIFWLAAGNWRNKFIYAGILFAILVWIRPNAVLILPFVFFCKELNKRQLLGGLAAGALFLGAITIIFGQVHYWVDFYSSVREWTKNTTSGNPLIRCSWGVSMERKAVPFTFHVRWRSELEDINSLSKRIFHTIIKPYWLFGTLAVAYIISFYLSIKRPARYLADAILFGILLYWFGEIVAPISRVDYYFIELFPVVLFLAGKYKELLIPEKLLLAGMVLFAFFGPLPMHLFLSELCFVAALAIYLVRKKIRHSYSHDIPAPY